jgi:hypothetical protein
VIDHLSQRLRHAAGNFYVNDKPTGTVVGQQPFGDEVVPAIRRGRMCRGRSRLPVTFRSSS